MSTEFTTLHDPQTIDAMIDEMDDGERMDVVHAADTNQIPIMSMNRWSEIGLVNESGRPTKLCVAVAARIMGRDQ